MRKNASLSSDASSSHETESRERPSSLESAIERESTTTLSCLCRIVSLLRTLFRLPCGAPSSTVKSTALRVDSGLLGTQQAYLMNSIYDTWAGTGGHQPYGHDTLATMYNRYKVLGCRVQLVFTTPGAANDMICVMAPSSNTSSGMTGLQLYAVQEWPQSVCGILPSSGERRCAASDVRHGDDRWREQGIIPGRGGLLGGDWIVAE